MAESRYEKYIVREAKSPPDLTPYLLDGMIPFRWMEMNQTKGLIEEAKTMVEFSWITKDCSMGHSAGRGPHKHDCDEVFIFLGTDPENPSDLGAEVEFWLGEGEESDKLEFNTSSFVFVPTNLLHMPIFFRNVKRPVLRITQTLNNFDPAKTVTDRNFPLRDL